jgi:hypothetical protein
MGDVPGLSLAVQVLHQARAVALLVKTIPLTFPFLLFKIGNQETQFSPRYKIPMVIQLFFAQGPAMNQVFSKTI